MSEHDEILDDEPKPKSKRKRKAKVVADEEQVTDPAYLNHMRVRGMSGPYPTEEPDDPTVQWSPRPGIVGCTKNGYRKIR